MEEIYTIERVYIDSDYNSNPVTVYATHDKKLAEDYFTRANQIICQEHIRRNTLNLKQ